MPFRSPHFLIHVNKPTVDTISVYTEEGLGWKTDGKKAGGLAPPDQIQDHFEFLIADLAPYVDDDSVWLDAETGTPVSAWTAIRSLAKADWRDEKA